MLHNRATSAPSSHQIPKKSRNGCLQCKRRKVKCNEQAPRCHNCSYRRVKCSYESSCNELPAATDRIPTTQSQYAGQVSTRSFNFPVQLSWSGNISPEDFELMHHYTTTASLSFADYDVYRPIWQVAVPREAQSYQFLMHIILALSAMHIRHLRHPHNLQALRYKELAHKHYQNAVTSFRSKVLEMDASNTSAVFAFSHLSLYFSFGSAQFANISQMQDPIGELLDIFVLLRKAMDNLTLAWDLVEAGSMAIFLQRGPLITDRRYLPAEISMGLELMEQTCQQFIESSQVGPIATETYRTAIQQLWDSFVMAQTKKKDWAMTLRFIMILPERFSGYLQQREPLALIILAHFCVILHRAPTRWWAEGWSTHVVGAVFEALPQDWRYAISWPMKEVGLDKEKDIEMSSGM